MKKILRNDNRYIGLWQIRSIGQLENMDWTLDWTVDWTGLDWTGLWTGLWTGVGGGEGVQGVSVFSIIFGSLLLIFFGFHYK